LACTVEAESEAHALKLWEEKFPAGDGVIDISGGEIDARNPLSIWDDHPEHTHADWVLEVRNNDTRCGYWDWVFHQSEMLAHPDS
jgi:hypothetical protein